MTAIPTGTKILIVDNELDCDQCGRRLGRRRVSGRQPASQVLTGAREQLRRGLRDAAVLWQLDGIESEGTQFPDPRR